MCNNFQVNITTTLDFRLLSQLCKLLWQIFYRGPKYFKSRPLEITGPSFVVSFRKNLKRPLSAITNSVKRTNMVCYHTLNTLSLF